MWKKYGLQHCVNKWVIINFWTTMYFLHQYYILMKKSYSVVSPSNLHRPCFCTICRCLICRTRYNHYKIYTCREDMKLNKKCNVLFQGIILPQMYTAVVANILNVATNYVLLHVLNLGVMYVRLFILHQNHIQLHPLYYKPFRHSNHLPVPLCILSIHAMAIRAEIKGPYD